MNCLAVGKDCLWGVVVTLPILLTTPHTPLISHFKALLSVFYIFVVYWYRWRRLNSLEGLKFCLVYNLKQDIGFDLINEDILSTLF